MPSFLRFFLIGSVLIPAISLFAADKKAKPIQFVDLPGLSVIDQTADIEHDKSKWIYHYNAREWAQFTPTQASKEKQRNEFPKDSQYRMVGPVLLKLSNDQYEPPERIITHYSSWDKVAPGKDRLTGGAATVLDTTKPTSITTCRGLNKDKAIKYASDMPYNAENCRTVTTGFCYHLKEEVVGIERGQRFREYDKTCDKILDKERKITRHEKAVLGRVAAKHKENVRYITRSSKTKIEGKITDRYNPLVDKNRCMKTLRDCEHDKMDALADWNLVRVTRQNGSSSGGAGAQ